MIPADVRAFIESSVPSVPYLEAALLFRTSGTAERRATEVARHLYVDANSALALISELIAARLVASGSSGGFVYSPRPPEVATMYDRLADFYAHELVDLTLAIHAARQRRELDGGSRRRG